MKYSMLTINQVTSRVNHVLAIPIGMFLLLFPTLDVFGASLYQFTDLGPVYLSKQEAQEMRVRINDNDMVIGWTHKTSLLNSPQSGFSWDRTNGFQMPIDTTDNVGFSQSLSNENVVGFRGSPSGNYAAIRWSNNYVDELILGDLGGGWSKANAINENGDIVGESVNASSVTQAVIWTNGTTSILANLDNTMYSSAAAINNAQIVTGTLGPFGFSQAFYWDNGVVNVLSSINSSVVSSWASDINNLNQVVGGMQFQVTGNTPRGLRSRSYMWDQVAGLEDLGADIDGVSWAAAINDTQQIVGGRLSELINRQAVLWQDGDAFNLNVLAQNSDGWELLDATDINENGNIVGIAFYFETYHAFLLEPIAGSIVTSDLSISSEIVNRSNKVGNRVIDTNPTSFLRLSVTNHGPDVANNVNISTTFNKEIEIDNLNPASVNCDNVDLTNVLKCVVTQIPVGQTTHLDLNLITSQDLSVTFSSSIKSDELDAGVNDNNVTEDSIDVFKQKILVEENADADKDASSEDNAGKSDGEVALNNTPTQQRSGGGCSLVSSHTKIDPTFFIILFILFFLNKVNRFRLHQIN